MTPGMGQNPTPDALQIPPTPGQEAPAASAPVAPEDPNKVAAEQALAGAPLTPPTEPAETTPGPAVPPPSTEIPPAPSADPTMPPVAPAAPVEQNPAEGQGAQGE